MDICIIRSRLRKGDTIWIRRRADGALTRIDRKASYALPDDAPDDQFATRDHGLVSLAAYDYDHAVPAHRW